MRQRGIRDIYGLRDTGGQTQKSEETERNKNNNAEVEWRAEKTRSTYFGVQKQTKINFFPCL